MSTPVIFLSLSKIKCSDEKGSSTEIHSWAINSMNFLPLGPLLMSCRIFRYLDIQKAINKMSHRRLPYAPVMVSLAESSQLSSCSSLVGPWMSSLMDSFRKPLKSIQDVPQSSLFVPTLYLLYINDLSRNILRSLVNIYADDIDSWSSKNLDNQSLASDLSPGLALTGQ